MIYQYKENSFDMEWLNAEKTRLSVICADPVFDSNGIDQTQWPSDKQISEFIGKTVEFKDIGDSNDGVEGIFGCL